MCVLVISSHGTMENNKQKNLFSDRHLVALYELIKPVQKKMVNRPFLIFVQACRGDFFENLTDDGEVEYQRYHMMRDTFIFYASTQGNFAVRPGDRIGRTEELTSISALVVQEMSKETAEVIIGDQMVPLALLPTIEQSLTRLVRFRSVSVTEIEQCQNITVEDICVTVGSIKKPGLTYKEKKVID